MNEQNNNVNVVPNPQPATPNPVPAPVSAVTPSPAPAPAPAASQQVATVAPQNLNVAPTSAPAPTPAPGPAPVPVATPVAPQPTPVPAAPNPVTPPVPTPVTQPVASPAPAPVHTDIVQSEPLNPIANNATVAPAQPTAPTLSPTQPQPMPITPNNNNNAGFVPNAAPLPKKKNKGLIIGIVVVVIAVLACLGIFVIWPMVKKSLTTPKMVYEVAIKDVTKEINATIDDVVHDKSLVDLSLGIDSNMPTISSFSGYTYGVNAGLDSTNKAVQLGLYMKNSTTEYSLYNYIKDGKKYSRYSTDNQLNYLGELTEEESNQLLNMFKEAMESENSITNEEANYVVNKISELLISSLNEDKFTREETTIKVDDKSVKVLNNKYVIDEATAEAMEKHIMDGLKADSKAVTILAKMMQMSEDEVKEKLTLKEDKEEDKEEESSTLILNLYTSTDLAKSIGFAITDDKGNADIHYYSHEKVFEFGLYSKEVDEETNEDVETKITAIGLVRDKGTNISITVDDKKVMTVVINENTENKLDLSYEVFGDEGASVTGTFKMTLDENDKQNKVNYEFTMKAGDQYINVTLNLLLDWTSEVANINTSNAVQVTDADIQNKTNQLMTQIYQTPVGIFLQTMSGYINSGVQDYYDGSSV